jgi:hypothetical protein
VYHGEEKFIHGNVTVGFKAITTVGAGGGGSVEGYDRGGIFGPWSITPYEYTNHGTNEEET